MNHPLNRRPFITTSLAAGVGLGLGRAHAQAQTEGTFKTRLRKALIISKPTEEDFRKLKEAGFYPHQRQVSSRWAWEPGRRLGPAAWGRPLCHSGASGPQSGFWGRKRKFLPVYQFRGRTLFLSASAPTGDETERVLRAP